MSNAGFSAMSAGIIIREATERDTIEMVEVVNAAFEEEAFFVSAPRTHPAQMADHFRSGHFLVAYMGRQLVASVYYEPRGERGYIGMLAVRPGQQRRGLGGAMMRAAEGVLCGLGCSFAEIAVVNIRTALLEVYRKLGYVECGVAEPPEELLRKLTMPVTLIKMEKPL